MQPSNIDIQFAEALARHLGQHPLFDLSVQAGIRHNVLGGLWYAAALFVCWVQGSQPGAEAQRRRVLTILLGTVTAVVFSLLAGKIIVWPAPAHYADLAVLYPKYLDLVPFGSSFPSGSATLYAAVAAGVYSIHKLVGSLLAFGVILIVGLPRIYVGGHYPTDVLAGFLIGVAGFAFVRRFLEGRLSSLAEAISHGQTRLRVLGELIVFAWILEVALECRNLIWLKHGLEFIWSRR